MPWTALMLPFRILLNQRTSAESFQLPNQEAYVILFLFPIILSLILFIIYQNWNGQKSRQQYEREQRKEDDNLLSEGIREFLRSLTQKKVLEKYSDASFNQNFPPVTPRGDDFIKAWELQACELIRLSSFSYSFSADSDWHDKQGCWIGENIDTNQLVALYPAQSSLTPQQLDEFINYVRLIARNRAKNLEETILAFQDEKSHQTIKQITNLQDIRVETENSLLEKLVIFTDYYRDIKKRVSANLLPESELTLDKIYVPSEYIQSNDERVSENIEEYLRRWLSEKSQRQIALLGEYGQGKSSSTLMLTYHLISNPRRERIPILIELRGKSPRNLTSLELLAAWASPYRIDPKALMQFHYAGRLLLIFEGFDEMALIGNTENRIAHFRTLWQFCHSKAKIIFTGRPNFFLDDQELKISLAIARPIGDNFYCEAIRLAPFTVEQIREALREQMFSLTVCFCSLATQNSRFSDIVARPSLLYVISLLWEKEKFADKVDRLNSAYVMECFVNSSYRRQGLKAQDAPDFMALNTSEREYFMSAIASYMVSKNLSNHISGEALNRLVEFLIEVIPDSVSKSEILTEERRPLKTRIQPSQQEDIEHIKTDVRTCGLLVDDPATPGTFKFGHKSFMEYIFAETIFNYIKDSQSEKSKNIVRVTAVKLEKLLNYPESIEFLSELIGLDNSLTNQTKKEKRPIKRAIARKILKVIYDKAYCINRAFLFLQIFIISLNNFKWIRFVQKNILILNGLMIFMVIFTNFRIKSILFSVVLLLYFLLVFYSIYLLLFKNYTNKKIRLWSIICYKMTIEDRVLHEVIGTSILPWAKNQHFDYFLSKSEHEQSKNKN